MLQEGQWYIDGYCQYCGAPRYVNHDLGLTKWKNDGYDCLHEVDHINPKHEEKTYGKALRNQLWV